MWRQLLVHQLPQIPIGLQHGRANAAQQPRLDLAGEAENGRCDGDHQRHLQRLKKEIDDQRHVATKTSRAIKVQNTSVR